MKSLTTVTVYIMEFLATVPDWIIINNCMPIVNVITIVQFHMLPFFLYHPYLDMFVIVVSMLCTSSMRNAVSSQEINNDVCSSGSAISAICWRCDVHLYKRQCSYIIKIVCNWTWNMYKLAIICTEFGGTTLADEAIVLVTIRNQHIEAA